MIAITHNNIHFAQTYAEEWTQTLKQLLQVPLADSEYVAQIVQSFRSHILQNIQNVTLLQTVTGWIIDNAQLLSLGDQLVDSFVQDMKPESSYAQWLSPANRQKLLFALNIADSVDSMKEALTPFLQEIHQFDNTKNEEAKAHYRQASVPEQRKIVIITARSGGGHLSQARAIEQFLKERGFIVKIIELQKVYRKFDPLYLTGVKFSDGQEASVGEIYNKFTAQNRNLEEADSLQAHAAKLTQENPEKYPCDAQRLMIEKMRKFQPRMIFYNLPGNINHFNLAYRLNCPMMILHCDYLFLPGLTPFYQRQQTLPLDLRLLGFGVAAKERSILPEQIDPQDPSIHLIGLPTQSTFKPIEDPEQIKISREKYNIKEGHLVISISRGLLGALEHLRQSVDELLASKESIDTPIDVIVICGENRQSKKFLEVYTQGYPQPDKPFTFHIHGMKSAAEMNEIVNISDIIDIKGGGGSVQEFLVSVGTKGSTRRAIVTAVYDWERPNAYYLQSTGLAKVFDQNNPHCNDKIALVKQLIGQQSLPAPLVDWKSRLLEVV